MFVLHLWPMTISFPGLEDISMLKKPSFYLSIYLSIYLSTYLSIYLSLFNSIFFFIYVSARLFIIYLSTSVIYIYLWSSACSYLSIYLSICLLRTIIIISCSSSSSSCSCSRVFRTRISWWSFTGVWVTASLLKPPGLFSVFWPILTMQ